jgi:hypothetical protein
MAAAGKGVPPARTRSLVGWNGGPRGRMVRCSLDAPGEELTMQPLCDSCSGPLALAVTEGRWGPIVRAQCGSCQRCRTPYEGPGAREAIFASRSRESVEVVAVPA